MKRVMKRIMFIMLMILSSFLAFSQSETITATAQSDELANDLDLKALATAFGESSSVEAFELKLNDASLGLTNLDLNGDGNVDYLRCVESESGNQHTIIIQAVLAKDIYQDVATILVVKDQTSGTVTTQVIGDEYIYGANYIVQPVYIYRPVIYDWFYGPYYVCWHSPYYWDYWPHYYHCWHHCHYHDYWRHMYDYHHSHPMSYSHPGRPIGDPHHGDHKQDFANHNSDRGYSTRHPEGGNVRTNRGDLRQPTHSGETRVAHGSAPQGGRSAVAEQPNRTVTIQRGGQPQRGGSSASVSRSGQGSQMRTQPAPSRSSGSVSSQRSSSSQPSRTFNGGSSSSRNAFSGPTRSSGSGHSSSPSRGSFSGSSHSSSSRGSFSGGSHSSSPSRSSGSSHSSGGSRSSGSHSSGGSRSGGGRR